MKHLKSVGTATIVAAACLSVLGLQGTALAAGFGGGHGGGGGHGFGGGRGGFGGHAAFAGRGFAGRGVAGRGFGGRGYYGGRGYGYGRYGYGGYGWGLGWGLGLGLWLSVLPWDYETLWWDGEPYYYADDAYYSWDPQVNQYQQVQPPPQVAQQAATSQVPADTELFAYPKSGQSDQQQAADKAACRDWARGQSNYNPADAGSVAAPSSVPAPPPATSEYTTTPPPVPVANAAANAGVGTYGTANGAPGAASSPLARRANYMRAEAACLEGRGYSVK